ncbi:MAG: hypothetical protein DME22_18605 [Verrucomicrobia bacterium]|nr:MAG: hypothetical protein DME22_18605 [Verrucomicrobiota bacterium]PYJ98618.1 MAG: hypothetical protein DME23_11590 [Verrucomicrobiota bacterium]
MSFDFHIRSCLKFVFAFGMFIVKHPCPILTVGVQEKSCFHCPARAFIVQHAHFVVSGDAVSVIAEESGGTPANWKIT